jgi:hypothetical protein
MRAKSPALLIGTLALTACAAAQPTAPEVLALPPAGKDLAQFQQDDLACRGFAQQQIGAASPQQAANQSAAGTAVAGTAVGAAAGAAIGAAAGAAGAGAAIGAATGLLAGSAIGVNAAAASGVALQQRYDIGYAQCMAAHGNQVQSLATLLPYGYYAYPYQYGYWPYYDSWYGPFVGVGFFGAFGPHFHHHGFHDFAHGGFNHGGFNHGGFNHGGFNHGGSHRG